MGTEKLPELVNRRMVWPSLAFALGLVPLFFFMWPIFPLTGGGAVVGALYGWNKPGSLVKGRRRGLAVVAIILGLLQLAIFVLVVFGIMKGVKHV
jgi:hypothetical protein